MYIVTQFVLSYFLAHCLRLEFYVREKQLTADILHLVSCMPLVQSYNQNVISPFGQSQSFEDLEDLVSVKNSIVKIILHTLLLINM